MTPNPDSDWPPSQSDNQALPSLAHYEKTLLGKLDKAGARAAPRIILAAIVTAVLVVPAVQSVVRIRKIDKSILRAEGQRHQTALGRWLPTAAVLADGSANPYGFGHWFPTPPLVLMSLVPLQKMGYAAAGTVWAALKIVGFVAAMIMLVRELSRSGLTVPFGVLLMAVAFGIRPIISDLQHANLNIFMVIWVALAWVFYLRGRDFTAGLFTALAIVTKVTPALLLLYFLYKRRWNVCLGAAIGLIVFVLVIPGLYLGFARSMDLHESWFHMLVEPYAKDGWVTLEIANQSLYGALMRVMSNAGLLKIESMPGEQAIAVGMEDMARPVTMLGKLIRPTITLGTLAILGWLCRERSRDRRDLRHWLEFALVLLAMLLMGERTWKHHATTLPIVFLIVWYVLTCAPLSDRFRAWFVGGLGAQFMLLVAGGEAFWGDRIADLMLDGGFFCWGILLAAVQTAALLIRLERPGGEGARRDSRTSGTTGETPVPRCLCDCRSKDAICFARVC